MVNTQIKWPQQPNAAILMYNQKKKNERAAGLLN